MKVLFLEHVINVAKPWEIKDVKPGYAQNMLFPKKLAIELTPKAEKEYMEKLKREDAHKRELIENRHKIIDEINGTKLKFKLKTWANGKVYWGIWEKDIIKSIKSQFWIELTKKHIDLPGWHIKKLWESQVFIKLGKDAMAKLTALVESE